MEASDSLRQKKIKFFCPILDTSTYSQDEIEIEWNFDDIFSEQR